MIDRQAEPHLFIVLGGRGDLMQRKLLPALYRFATGPFSTRCIVLGAARDATTDDQSYRAWAIAALVESGLEQDSEMKNWTENLYYQSVGGDQGYQNLAQRIAALEEEHVLSGNRVFYLALPPEAFPTTIKGLGQVKLNQGPGWTRLVVEKPFGHDLKSAQDLNRKIHRCYAEEQVYRIDHYLGKETVQNLLVFRFANPLFERAWNRDQIERVEITVAESMGIGNRARYYEQAGAIRDMVQNHLTQILTLTAMEVPAVIDADTIRDEKVKVLRSITPIAPEHVICGQYTVGEVAGVGVLGYHSETDVASDSVTETFVAMRLEIANWRWQGVPFVLRTGKRLPHRTSQVVVTFRPPPLALFGSVEINPNRLVITIQPDEGFDLSFEVKEPSGGVGLKTEHLRFRYAEANADLIEAYDTLLLDVMIGDATLFVRADEVEAAWRLFTPVIKHKHEIYPYAAGTWGPLEAERL